MAKFHMQNRKQADAVLKALKALTKDWKKEFNVHVYENGREHGWYIDEFPEGQKAVAFSEFRRSDNVIVYRGNRDQFSEGSGGINVPSEAVYDAKEFFDYGEYSDAANFIANFFKS